MFLLLLCLGFCLNLNAQTDNYIPEKGTMVFVQDKIVTNETKLDSSYTV